MSRKRCIVCPNKFEGPGSRCPEHSRSNWDRYKPAHREVYRTSQGRNLRARVLGEDPTCAVEGCQERSTSVDHIVPLADGGDPFARSNVRGLCYSHHRRRSSQQGAEGRKRQRNQQKRRAMRTPQQARFGSAHHEASHCVMAFLLGHQIDSVRLFNLEPIPEEGEIAGRVFLSERPINNRWDALEEIETLLAGEAGVRTSWALKALSNEQIGGEEIPGDELTLEEVIVSSNGATPTQKASHLGWYDRSDVPDEVNALALAREWSADPIEAQAMLAYARARVVNVVATPVFQKLTGLIATALLERDELTGSHVIYLLSRGRDLFEMAAKLEERNRREGED